MPIVTRPTAFHREEQSNSTRWAGEEQSGVGSQVEHKLDIVCAEFSSCFWSDGFCVFTLIPPQEIKCPLDEFELLLFSSLNGLKVCMRWYHAKELSATLATIPPSSHNYVYHHGKEPCICRHSLY